MKIETTININSDLLHKLEKSSLKISKSKSFLTIHLLKQLRMSGDLNYEVFSRVSYQEKNPHKNWHHLHLRIFANEYEIFLDMRKIYKKSVSWLLAYAIKMFLEKVINSFLKKSYHFELTDNYIIIFKKSEENNLIWSICWGFSKINTIQSLLI